MVITTPRYLLYILVVLFTYLITITNTIDLLARGNNRVIISYYISREATLAGIRSERVRRMNRRAAPEAGTAI